MGFLYTNQDGTRFTLTGITFQANDSHSENAEHEDECAVRVPDITPTLKSSARTGIGGLDMISCLIRFISAGVGIVKVTVILWQGQKWPCKGGCYNRGETPPASHQCDQPLLLARKILKEDGGVKDEISAGAKRGQGREESENLPSRRRACHNGEDGADKEGHVEGKSTSNNVGALLPSMSAVKGHESKV